MTVLLVVLYNRLALLFWYWLRIVRAASYFQMG